MRSAKAEQSPQVVAESVGRQPVLCAGQSYLERLGVLYADEIRLTISMELYMREMGVRQFFETIGGSSYDSVRRHFLKLTEYGWIRKVRTVATGRGRPEALYRSTEQAVIDTAVWRTIPFSVRDGSTVSLLEELGEVLGGALESGLADARADQVAAFRILDLEEPAWCKAFEAVERCFRVLRQEQTDAKIRLESGAEQPILMRVNLAAFEAPANETGAKIGRCLPEPDERTLSTPWPRRIGRVFMDLLDLAIVDELNKATMTPAQLQAALGGTSSQGFLRRCKRLTELGLAVSVDIETGGALRGASAYHFRAAAPKVSESKIFESIPVASRKGPTWEVFEQFIATSSAAVEAGTFNRRFDRHLTTTPLLVDETGWVQVTKALRTLEETLNHLDNLAKRHCNTKGRNLRGGFLSSSFQAPLRELRH
jgi:hypothetical protein